MDKIKLFAQNDKILLMEKKIIVWIFCNVIDNFGDAGICLRLANLLSIEFNYKISIWIDNLHVLQKLQSKINPDVSYQRFNKISFFYLKNFDNYKKNKAPNCIIEILGAKVPKNVIKLIENDQNLWINLEYLSAEQWVQNYHLMQSIQATNIKKYFYFQGFTENSGGLIREKDYVIKRKVFFDNPIIKIEFIKNNNIFYKKNKIKIFIFGYSNPIWEEMITTLKLTNKEIIIWFANHSLLDNLSDNLKFNYNIKNDVYIYNNITLQKVKFVEQKFFDYYLWLCDIAIVRGEDSFLRAQFAYKIFLWNIYPQSNKIHILKLNAFLNVLKQHIPNDLFQSIYKLSMEINDFNFKLNVINRLQHWQNIIYNIQKHGFKNWNNFLLEQKTAVEKLTQFIQNKLKY